MRTDKSKIKSKSKRKTPVIVSRHFAKAFRDVRHKDIPPSPCHSASTSSSVDADDFPFYDIDQRRIPFYFLSMHRPKLIQDELIDNPFQLLVATMLLNKTTGKAAIPIFRQLMETWPTPELMSKAPVKLLAEILLPLGLYNTRAQRLVDLAQMYLLEPPSPTILHKSRAKNYGPTPISHFPGVGKYALDSYRIFCTMGDEWKQVQPTDIPLGRYLKWRWAVEENKVWTPDLGVVGDADDDYFAGLIPYYRDAHIADIN